MVNINRQDLINNLIAELVWAIFVLILIYAFQKPILKWVKRVRPKIDSSIPHLDFHAVYKPNANLKSDITIKNAGGEPAYNTYVFLFVEFPDKSYSIKSLGGEGVRSGVLGKGEKIVFQDKEMLFDGCDITCLNEVWVEFSNAAGVNFRTVVRPPSPRGDDWKMLPPKVIKKRLSQIPGFHNTYTDKRRKKIIKGRSDLPEFVNRYPLKFRLRNWGIMLKQHLKNFKNRNNNQPLG